jgi:hypothetical protein
MFLIIFGLPSTGMPVVAKRANLNPNQEMVSVKWNSRGQNNVYDYLTLIHCVKGKAIPVTGRGGP